MRFSPDRAALVLVDVQQAFDDPVWGPRNNPDCEANVGRLLAHWRERGGTVVFVRHDSAEPGSPLAPSLPGNAFMPVIEGEPDLLVTKDVNSAFLGTPRLEPWLRERGLDAIVIAGIQTNMCCETTARMGGNLGFDVAFALDATCTFDLPDPINGGHIDADTLARVTAANLHDEFAQVMSTAALIDGS
jgi:nicotinamidase-related amidase